MLIKFRNPKEIDIPELIKLARKFGFDKEDVLLPLNYSKENCFVIEIEGRIAGANLYIKVDKNLAYSSLWFIEPEYEKMMLEGELQESADIDLKKLGIKKLIGTISKKDKRMMKLFKEIGWKKAGEAKDQFLIYKELK